MHGPVRHQRADELDARHDRTGENGAGQAGAGEIGVGQIQLFEMGKPTGQAFNSSLFALFLERLYLRPLLRCEHVTDLVHLFLNEAGQFLGGLFNLGRAVIGLAPFGA